MKNKSSDATPYELAVSSKQEKMAITIKNAQGIYLLIFL